MVRFRSIATSAVIATFVLAATATLYFIGLRRGEQATGVSAKGEVKAVAVTVAEVKKQTVQRLAPIVGTLFGLEEVPVSARVDGRIIHVLHDVGDVVRPGDPLFEIDPTNYQLAVNEAERSLELELSKLGLKTPPSKDADFDVNRLPTVVRAASQLNLAELEYNRIKALLATASASQLEYDTVESDLVLAKASVEQAVLDAKTILASVRWKQASLDSANSDLAETRVVAPRQSGARGNTDYPVEYVVAERTVTEGEVVRSMGNQAAPAFRLVIADPLKLKAAVAERFKGEVRVGLPVGVLTEATGDKMFIGRVQRVNPTVDRANRTFQVEVEIPNKDRQLSAGSFAKAAIRTRLDENAITVPAESIVRFAGVVKVFVVRDGKVQGVTVALGEKVDRKEGEARTWIEVKGDLKAGEPIVTSGQSLLANDTPVLVRDSN